MTTGWQVIALLLIGLCAGGLGGFYFGVAAGYGRRQDLRRELRFTQKNLDAARKRALEAEREVAYLESPLFGVVDIDYEGADR